MSYTPAKLAPRYGRIGRFRRSNRSPKASGLTKDPIEGVWIGELTHLVPRAYTFTPYWNETADPALRKVLESIIIDPNADVASLLQQAAQDAQKALDNIKK